MKTSPENPARDPRLDYAKAISLCLVLIWHLNPIQIKTGTTSNIIEKLIALTIEQFSLQVTLIAVPTFILTSLFLLFQKLQTSNLLYIRIRLKRMFEIFAFWTACQFVVYYIFSGYASLKRGEPFSLHIYDTSFYTLIAAGGPSLPIVGSSVFYFLFNLTILIALSYLLLKFNNIKLITYIEIALIPISLIFFEIINIKDFVLPYWRIENFLIYIPLAHFSVKYKLHRNYILLLYLGFFLFSCQNFIFQKAGHSLTAYSRVSIVFGAMAFFHTLLNMKSDKTPSKAVSFLSTFSLGIFATHKYWQLLILYSSPKTHFLSYFPSDFSLGGFTVDLKNLIVAIITIALTILTVSLLSRSPFKRFIS